MDALKDYMRLVKGSAQEVQALFEDSLLCVTSFFRDPASFVALKNALRPRILDSKHRRVPLRIWSLGCATGEETYSLAMVCLELWAELGEELQSDISPTLHATDLSAAAIETARAGIYAKSIAQDLQDDRLRRFFVELNDGYAVNSSLRALCTFSRHNALVEPPLENVDLICCRNVITYLDEAMQTTLYKALHRALTPSGILWLGSAENVEACSLGSALFTITDATHKLYIRKQPGA